MNVSRVNEKEEFETPMNIGYCPKCEQAMGRLYEYCPYCGIHLEEEAEWNWQNPGQAKMARTIEGDDQLKLGVWIFAQYFSESTLALSNYRLAVPAKALERSIFVLSGDKKLCERLIDERIVEKSLTDTITYFYESYVATAKARPCLVHYSVTFDDEVESVLSSLVKKQDFKTFLALCRERYGTVFVDEYQTPQFADFSLPFEKLVEDWARQKIVLLDYWPDRKRSGRQKSKPAEWIYKLTPAANRRIARFLF